MIQLRDTYGYKFYLETLVLLKRANSNREFSGIIKAIDQELNEK